MKQLMIIFAFFILSNIAVQAQEGTPASTQQTSKVRVDIKKQAKQEATAISNFLELDEVQTQNFYRLFEHKHKNLALDLSQERKEALKNIIEAKIRASLSEEKMTKLESNQELFQKLIN